MTNKTSYLYGLQVLSHCGSGAYGEVYYCQDASGKRVALKVISKVKIGSGWERELKGITNYRRLTEDSPLLLNIFHVGEDESSFYYTMEPADNAGTEEHYTPDTLAARLAHGPLPAERLLSTLKRLLECITALHAAGFAHRDIKPENILFVNGEPKLADLGLLSPLSGTLTQLAGTLDFLPPEERTGEGSGDSRESRQRNDLYAFGKIIYCCITGNGADQFPSLPSNIPLTLQNKLFFRLAIRLCDREPSRRLAKLEDVTAVFEDTVRMCQYGETLFDKLRYAGSAGLRNLAYIFSRLCKSAGRHWLLTLLCLAALGACAWYLWPRPPYDIAKKTTKPYTNAELGIEMEVPVEWEILSSQTAKEWLKDIKDDEEDLSEQDKKRIEFFASLLEHGCDYIICDYAEPNPDNITIQTVPVPGELLMETSDDELRVGMQQLFKGELGFDTKIYDFQRITLAGHPCIFIDLTHVPGTRVNNYLFGLEDQCFAIALTAREETFFERREQFQSILSTLKFEKETSK